MHEKFGLINYQRRNQQVCILLSAACSRITPAWELRVTSHKEGDLHSHTLSERKNKMFSFEKKKKKPNTWIPVLGFLWISVKYFTIYDHELCYLYVSMVCILSVWYHFIPWNTHMVLVKVFFQRVIWPLKHYRSSLHCWKIWTQPYINLELLPIPRSHGRN